MSVSEWDVCPHCGGNGDDPDRCDEYCDQGCCPVCQGLGRVPPDNVVEAAAKAHYERLASADDSWEDEKEWGHPSERLEAMRAALVAAALEEGK